MSDCGGSKIPGDHGIAVWNNKATGWSGNTTAGANVPPNHARQRVRPRTDSVAILSSNRRR